MDYAEFKTHLAGFLWKQNDTVLIASLDNLIVMAHAEMSRVLKISAREITSPIVVDSNEAFLPTSFRQLVSLSHENGQPYTLIIQEQLDRLRLAFPTTCKPYFHLSGSKILLSEGYSIADPVTLNMTFRPTLPDFQATDSSWLADDYLDFYTYAVLKHTAPFLREDERVALWNNFFTSAKEDILEEDAYSVSYGASPIDVNLSKV